MIQIFIFFVVFMICLFGLIYFLIYLNEASDKGLSMDKLEEELFKIRQQNIEKQNSMPIKKLDWR